jgi:hypothetical protein
LHHIHTPSLFSDLFLLPLVPISPSRTCSTLLLSDFV